MPITPSVSAPIQQFSAVTLSRYAQIIEKDECAFWGIFNAPGQIEEDCGYIWTKANRRTIAKYLAEAQREIERRLRYPLSPKWITGLVKDQRFHDMDFTDTQHYKVPSLTEWGRVIEGGVFLETLVEDNVAVIAAAADPYVFNTAVAAPNGIEPNDVRIYHAGTDDEIMPSAVTILAGNLLNIEIPRCRMVKPSIANAQGVDGIDYQVLTNFSDKIKVNYARTDISTNADIVKHTCDSSCDIGCGESTQSACITVKDSDIGHIVVIPATFNDTTQTWSSGGSSCRVGNRIRLNYRAGTYFLDEQAEDAIVRLAHSKMPDEPCNCAQGQRLWKRDRFVPKILTAQRLNCPFGLNDGAWISWLFASDMKNITMTVF